MPMKNSMTEHNARRYVRERRKAEVRHNPAPIGPGPPVLALCAYHDGRQHKQQNDEDRGDVASGSPAEHSPPPRPTYALLPLRGIGTAGPRIPARRGRLRRFWRV